MKKARVENFMIPTVGTAVPTAGDRLYDFTTDAINLAIGAFGVYTGTANSGNPTAINSATVTSATTDYIQFFNRRDTSADMSPLYTRTLEKSPEIKADCFLRATGRTATVKNNNMWLMGAAAGTAGEVSVFDETEYQINAGMRGWNVDLYNGNNTPFKSGRYTTPDYTASTLYTLDTQRRDHLLQYLAVDFNSQSPNQILAMCLDSTASVTPVVPPALNPNYVYTITQIAAFAVGTSLIIGFTDAAQPITLTLDAALKQTFTLLAVTYGAYQLIPYARPTAANLAVTGRLVAGGRTAGSPDAEVDHLLYLALDQKLATYDEKSQTKDRIQVGGDGGMADTTSVVVVDPSEGSGYARDVLTYYRDSQGHRKYPGGKPWQPMFVEFPSNVVAGGIYDIYVIDSCENRTASSGMPSSSPQRTIIAVLNTTTVGFTGYTGVANPQKAYVVAVINNWMNSTVYPHTNV